MMDSIRALIRETGMFLLGLFAPAARSIRDNTGLAAVSVVLAFGLWILVTDAENPTRTRVLPINLPVQAVNVPADVVVDNDLVSVQVRVSVADQVFESLTASDFEATIDIEGLDVGQWDRPVEVRTLTTRGGLRVDDVSPANIAVHLAPLVSKDVPVVLDIQGSPPEGYAVSDPSTDDAAVRVSGSQARVDLVTQAFAAIDVVGHTDTIEQSIRLAARDDHENPIEGVILEPGITSVSVDITQVVYSRPVVVEPVIEGVPADGYEVLSVSARPLTVVVSGDKDFISQVQTIRTESIDIDGENGEVVRSVSLDLSGLPEGTQVTGTGNVTITIGIRKRAEESTSLPAPLLSRT
jgi:YbbR domain-containing protein